MKKYIIVLSFILISSFAFCQNWQWAKHIGSDCPPQNERIVSTITDGSNIYVFGAYFGCLYLQNDTLTSNGLNDGFIIKYDAGGNELWSKTLGGSYNQLSSQEEASGVYDPVNNCIYVAGRFIGSINFGGTVNLNSTHPNDEDIFIARMDLNGNFIWAKQGGSSGTDLIYSFAEPDGDVFLAGKLANPGLIETASISSGGFFARFDSNGNLKWAEHKFSGPDAYKLSFSFIGTDLIMGGTYSQNPSTIDTATLIPNGAFDGFITRLDSIGRMKWIKTIGGAGGDGISGVSTDNSNNIYSTGAFTDSINIDGSALINSGTDFLLAKFDANSSLIWARQSHASNITGGNEILSDNDGDCYVIGNFSGNAQFGTYNVSTTNIYDMFLTRYSSNGDCLGIRHFGYASGFCIAADNSNNAICGGVFQNTVNIDGNIFTSYAGYDIYLTKIDEFTDIGGEERTTNNQLIIYANPNKGTCNITVPDDFLHEKNLTLSIYNNAGKLIQQKTLQMNDGKIKLNLEAEAKGVYNVNLSNGKKSYVGKIVFE